MNIVEYCYSSYDNYDYDPGLDLLDKLMSDDVNCIKGCNIKEDRRTK